jgi:hypothetical protein
MEPIAMSKRMKRGLIVFTALLLVAGLGILGGLYFLFEVYPEWRNEKLDVFDTAGQTSERNLIIGEVLHGRQLLPPDEEGRSGDPLRDFSRFATTYYHRIGPVGRVFEELNWFPGPDNTFSADSRMPTALVGLGATSFSAPLNQAVGLWSEPPFAAIFVKDGCLASYARPFQVVDFYERNPAIIHLSQPPPGKVAKFTFIEDARKRGANVRIVEGPERKGFADHAPKSFYRVVVVETIRGHVSIVSRDLITKDAMSLFFEAMTDDGILLVHTSNRDYDLAPVVGDVASSLGLSCAHLHNTPATPARREPFASEWVLVARRQEHLDLVKARIIPAAPGGTGGTTWQWLRPTTQAPWTDGGRNALSLHRR